MKSEALTPSATPAISTATTAKNIRRKYQGKQGKNREAKAAATTMWHPYTSSFRPHTQVA